MVIAGDRLLLAACGTILGRQASRFVRGLNRAGCFTVLLLPSEEATPQQFDRYQRDLRADLGDNGARIDAVERIESAGAGLWRSELACHVAAEHRFDLDRSYVVADEVHAIEMARGAGMRSILVGAPHAKPRHRPDLIAPDLDAALSMLRRVEAYGAAR